MAPPLSLRGVYDSLRWPGPRDLIFSAKAFLATAVALLVGFSQDMENPYWAVLTIYVVLTPPESGAVRSKALFRLIGTIGGGLLMMAVTGLFGDQLGILVTATIGIIAGGTYLRQIDRTPANYIWFSGGVTAGVVGLVNLMQPLQMFDYATARMGEISLGILAIAAVDSLVWPRAMTPDFLATMRDWRRDARKWVIEALGRTAPEAPDEERRQQVRAQLRDLTKAVGVIDAKAVQLPFDIVPSAPRGRDLNLVRRQVVSLIADLAAIETWTRSLRRMDSAHPHLDEALATVSSWVRDSEELPTAAVDAHSAHGDALIAQLDALRGELDPDDRSGLVERGMVTRLIAFVHDWSDLGLALRSVETGRRLSPRLARIASRAKPVRSIDYLGALFDVAPMVLSTSFTAALWYFTAWQSGAGALLFSFVGCVFLIGQGQILRSSAGLITCIIAAFAFVFLYQYAILPRVTDFVVLITVLGMAMVPFGLLMTMSMAGMLMCVYIFSFLGLQDAYAADFNQSLLTLSSSLVGLFIAVTCLYLCSYDHARFASRRLVRAVRLDILDLARSRHVPDRERLLFLTVDRLALYFPVAEQVAAGGPLPRIGMLDDLRIGINLLMLRGQERHAAPATRGAIDALRKQTVSAFRRKLAGLPDDGSLLASVDATLEDEAVRAEPRGGDLREALIGMRLALADDGSPYPREPTPDVA